MSTPFVANIHVKSVLAEQFCLLHILRRTTRWLMMRPNGGDVLDLSECRHTSFNMLVDVTKSIIPTQHSLDLSLVINHTINTALTIANYPFLIMAGVFAVCHELLAELNSIREVLYGRR
jgi:hypothetical protein